MVTDETTTTLQGLMVSHTGLVVNNPFNNHLANNKLEQLKRASSFGLSVPDTIITNNPKDALDFYHKHDGDIIFKMQKLPLVEDEGKYSTVLTQRLKSEDLQNFEMVRNNPCCFQNYIDKDYEIRLIVIDKKLFPIAIYSQLSDYSKNDFRRYDFDKVKYEIMNIPEDLKVKVNSLVDSYGLHYAAIDIIKRPNGQYVF